MIGQEATGGRINDSDFFLATQMKLIGSDSVLRPVVQSLRIKVSTAHPDAPVTLPYLTVTRPPKTYLLQISYRSPDPVFAADVANAVAKSYIDHSYAIRYQASAGLSTFMTKELEDLQAKMERSGAALSQYEKELNVINPQEKTNILSARLLQLNTEYTNAQAERFRKESVAKSVKEGSLESLEATEQGLQLRNLADKLADDTEKFETVKAQYGTNHPAYKKAAAQHAELQRQFEALRADITRRVDIEYREAANREQLLKQTLDETKTESDNLNGKNFEYTNLKRDADADRALYEELTRKIKEAGINAGFQNSSIRLADLARPAIRPVFPKVRQNAMLAFAISLFLGIGVVFITDNLDHTLRDPEQIQRQLQAEVLGSLPVVKAWRGHLPGSSKADGTRAVELFGSTKGAANTYEEAVRTLRDSILLPHAEKRPRQPSDDVGDAPRGKDHYRGSPGHRPQPAEAEDASDRCRPAAPGRLQPRGNKQRRGALECREWRHRVADRAAVKSRYCLICRFCRRVRLHGRRQMAWVRRCDMCWRMPRRTTT